MAEFKWLFWIIWIQKFAQMKAYRCKDGKKEVIYWNRRSIIMLSQNAFTFEFNVVVKIKESLSGSEHAWSILGLRGKFASLRFKILKKSTRYTFLLLSKVLKSNPKRHFKGFVSIACGHIWHEFYFWIWSFSVIIVFAWSFYCFKSTKNSQWDVEKYLRHGHVMSFVGPSWGKTDFSDLSRK